MLSLSVEADFSAVWSKFAHLESGQIERRVAIALNKTAGGARRAVQDKMRQVFDRPTPFALNVMRIAPARPDKLEAVVGFRQGREFNPFAEPPAYVAPQIAGGQRPLKRFEQMLRRARYYTRRQSLRAKGGAVDFGPPRQVLPDGYQVVPGSGMQLDAYGNIPRGDIVRILGYFEAFQVAGFKANATFAGREKKRRATAKRVGFELFVVHPGDRTHLAPGIWRRLIQTGGQKIEPLLLFVRPGAYRARLPFEQIVRDIVARDLQANIADAFSKAPLAT